MITRTEFNDVNTNLRKFLEDAALARDVRVANLYVGPVPIFVLDEKDTRKLRDLVYLWGNKTTKVDISVDGFVCKSQEIRYVKVSAKNKEGSFAIVFDINDNEMLTAMEVGAASGSIAVSYDDFNIMSPVHRLLGISLPSEIRVLLQ